MTSIATVQACSGSTPIGPIESSPAGWFRWRPTDAARLQQSEALMLQRINHYQDFVAGLNTISNVKIEKGGSAGEKGRDVLLLIHGFAGGLACWVQNWEFFSAHYELYAIDLPGFGRSLRPLVKIDSSEGAMHFICFHLERWFSELGFKRPVVILGHSFGGFVAAHYAMRFGKSRVKLLALADPWGVNEADPHRIKRAPLHMRLALKLFYAVNPLAVLRAAGPAGPKFFQFIRPDFASRWEGYLSDPKAFYEYTYHCNAQLPPLGEKLFRACCHADIAAKEPLMEVLPRHLSKEIPLALLYGSETWVNAERGFTMADKMTEEGYMVRAGTVMNAGHQVFTDNVEEFNETLLRMLRELLL